MRTLPLVALATVALFAPFYPTLPAQAAPLRGQAVPPTQAQDRAALLDGVHNLVAPQCLPGPLAVFGDNAFVLATGREGKEHLPLFAAAQAGAGRLVVGGHEGFFGAAAMQNTDNVRFFQNTLAWTSGGKALAGLRVGVLDGYGKAMIAQTGAAVVSLSPADLPRQLASVDVLFLDQDALRGNTAGAANVSAWLRGGGGVVISGPAWGWQQTNPEKSLSRDHSGNRLTGPFGIAFADGTLDSTGAGGAFTVNPDAPDLALTHATNALDALARHADKTTLLAPADLAQVTQTLAGAVAALPDNAPFAVRVRTLATRYGGDALPSRTAPITTAMPFARLKAVLDAQALRRLPADKVTAHPASATFPGPVPAQAPRLEAQTIAVDTHIPNWHSTGLYAAPGEVITITVPSGAARKGLGVRIGTHTDRLWNLAKWPRFPDISVYQPLTSTTVKVASAFGGAVLIDVPVGSTLGVVTVRVDGAVAAPYFVRGKTDLATWRNTLRNNPAPWAELQGDRVILSVPSSVVRALDDPDALMAYWDEVADRAADLYAIPRQRARQERYCADIEISAGYMHSGYPIMTHDDVALRFTNLAALRATGGDTWGFYHELGHNHQQRDWTWDGCGEVTNNLFSLYGGEVFNHTYQNGDYANAHGAIAPDKRKAVIAKYLAGGANYDEWKSQPFIALMMYIQLRQAFGWEPFTRVFAEYRDLPAGAHPKTDDERRDQWLVRFSRAVGRNLGPFYQAWGVPTSDAARAQVNNLPPWMPSDLPTRTTSNQ